MTDLGRINTAADLLAAFATADAECAAAVAEVEAETAWDAADELAPYRTLPPVGIHANQLSCQGLQQVLPDGPTGPTHYGKPVNGYEEEIRRRGEGHVFGCDLIGHGLPTGEAA